MHGISMKKNLLQLIRRHSVIRSEISRQLRNPTFILPYLILGQLNPPHALFLYDPYNRLYYSPYIAWCVSIQNTNCVVMPLKGFYTLKSYVMWVKRVVRNRWRLTAEHVVNIHVHYCREPSADLRSICGHSTIASGQLLKIFRDICPVRNEQASLSAQSCICFPHVFSALLHTSLVCLFIYCSLRLTDCM